jgi:hypothetical protein
MQDKEKRNDKEKHNDKEKQKDNVDLNNNLEIAMGSFDLLFCRQCLVLFQNISILV